MKRSGLHIGDCVCTRLSGSTSTAHVIWKGQSMLKIQMYVSGKVKTVQYEDVLACLTEKDKTLLELYPQHTDKHIYAHDIALCALETYIPTWDFQFDERPSRRAGQCSHTRKTISITFNFILHANRKDIRNTIMHEVAHALVGPNHNHDDVWRKKACELGCNGDRCHSVSFSEPRWIKRCPNGHWVGTSQKRALKRWRICKDCGARTVYERYMQERYAELEHAVVPFKMIPVEHVKVCVPVDYFTGEPAW